VHALPSLHGVALFGVEVVHAPAPSHACDDPQVVADGPVPQIAPSGWFAKLQAPVVVLHVPLEARQAFAD
jgi:hypothetical protein